MKIVVKGMSAGYGSTEILKDIDLEIGSGEKVFIGGSNGSGKTTLLKVMSGLIPHKGTVTVDGKEISTASIKVGQKVIAAKYSGTDIKIDDEEYTILHISDILAIVE